MALKKLDLEKVKEAKDKIITQKAQEYKLIKEKIEKVKQEYLVELESKELNLKKDIITLFDGVEERTRRFEDFTMTVTSNSMTRSTKYEEVVKGLYDLYGKTVDGFAETLEKLIDEKTKIGQKAGSVSLKAIKEGWLSDLFDSVVSGIKKLIDKVNSILVNKIDSNLDKLESKIQTLKENKKKQMKVSEVIKLIENKTGKKVSFQDSPKTLKEGWGYSKAVGIDGILKNIKKGLEECNLKNPWPQSEALIIKIYSDDKKTWEVDFKD